MTIPVRVATNNVSVPMSVRNDVVTPVETEANRIIPVVVSTSNVVLPVVSGVSEVVLPVTCGMSVGSSDYPWYEGADTFTPSQQTQTIQIQNHVAPRNITINPIPQNYGLITWNGSTLTVS